MKYTVKHSIGFFALAIGVACFSCSQSRSNTSVPTNHAVAACSAPSSFVYGGVEYSCYAQNEAIFIHFEAWLKANKSEGPLAYLVNEGDARKHDGLSLSAGFIYSKGDSLLLRWSDDKNYDDIAAVYPIEGLESPSWLGLTALYEGAPVFAVYNTKSAGDYNCLPACDAPSSFIYQGVKYDCYAREEMISVHFKEWPAADLSAGPLAYLINECDYEKFSGRFPSASFAYSKGDPLYLKWTEDGSLDDIAAIYPIKGLENPTWLGLTALYEDAGIFAVFKMR